MALTYDNFNNAAIDAAWTQVVGVTAVVGSFNEAGTELTITTGNGNMNGLGDFDPTWIYQAIAADEDFSVVLTYADPAGLNVNFEQVGIMFWEDDDNHIRVCQINWTGEKWMIVSRSGGVEDTASVAFDGAGTSYLWLVRNSGVFAAAYSNDGTTWVKLALPTTVLETIAAGRVGLYGNHPSGGQFTIALDDFAAGSETAIAGDEASCPMHSDRATVTLTVDMNITSVLEEDLPVLTISAHAGASAVMDLPVLTISATGLAGQACTLDQNLPVLTVEAYAGASAVNNLPVITLTATGTVGSVASLDVSLPVLEVEAYAGGSAETELPMLTLEATGTTGVVASLDTELPMLTLEATGTAENVIALDVSLPILELSATALSGTVGVLDCNLPLLEISAVSYGSNIGDADIDLPVLTISATGFTDESGDLDAELPMLVCYGEAWLSGRFDDYVLRYNR